MEIVLPTQEEIKKVNESRQRAIDSMSGNGNFMLVIGPCGVDENTMPTGEYASVVHGLSLNASSKVLADSDFYYRHNGTKARTSTGPTGLIHASGGAQIHAEQAQALVEADVSLAAEVADECDYAVSAGRLAIGWVGSRNEHDGGPRNLLRPTATDLENDILPVPTFVKNGQEGDFTGAINSILTLQSEEPVHRMRLTMDGPKLVTTLANPHVGLILRGNNKQQATEDLEATLLEEYVTAREVLDEEFGAGVIPIIFDLSHRHAAIAGGGAEGQRRVADKLRLLIYEGKIAINGIMAESYIQEGKQSDFGTEPGKCRYDKCMDEASAREHMQNFDDLQVLNRRQLRVAA